MFTSGLLVLTSPLTHLTPHIRALLQHATRHVEQTLYVHVAPGLFHGVHSQQNTGPAVPRPHLKVPFDREVMQFMSGLYSQAAAVSSADIRFLVDNISNDANVTPPQYQLHAGYQVLLAERHQDQQSLVAYVQKHMPVQNTVHLQVLEQVPGEESRGTLPAEGALEELKVYDHVVLGGTFDQLHAGHKILLTRALLKTRRSLTVGVTDGEMNAKKTLDALIMPVSDRVRIVEDFLNDVKPSLTYIVVPIVDPFGPSIVDPSLQCIVVSEETLRGGDAVNRRRQEKGLSTLDVDVIPLVSDEHAAPEEEVKISASSMRKRMLGTLRAKPKTLAESSPYLLGLTGGIASGKSALSHRLAGLGAGVVDCDKLGHRAYEPGTDAFLQVVEVFGQDVVGKDGRIDRRAVGAKVFADKSKLEKLNTIVWPSIKRLVTIEVQKLKSQGVAVVVLDAAVLLEAGWDEMVHEVWVAILPNEEVVRRIKARDGLDEEAALQRIEMQLPNSARVAAAHVVLSTQWAGPVTQAQVENAWKLLMERIK